MADLAKQFVHQFYTLYDTNRASLAQAYTPGAMLTINGEAVSTPQQICQKISVLPPTVHQVDSLDTHPSKEPADLICVVSGKIAVGGVQNHFFESFHLVNVNGGYLIHNEIFRTLGAL